MNKKQIFILLIATNLVSVIAVSLFFTIHQSGSKNAIAKVVCAEPNRMERVQVESKLKATADINSVIAQFDMVKSGRYKQAMEAYIGAIRTAPPYTAESGTSVTYYANHGYNDKATEVGEQDIQDTPQWPDCFYALAWVYAKVGKYDKAMEVCRKTVQLHPDYPYIWHISAWIHAKTGETEKAIAECNQALKLDPVSVKTNYALGRIYGMLGRQQEAIDAYKKTIQLKPDWAEPYLFLGLTYATAGNQDEAIKSYKEAIHFDRHYHEAHLFLAIAYDELGHCSKAIESFEQAITEYYSPGNAERIHSLEIRPDLTNIYCAI